MKRNTRTIRTKWIVRQVYVAFRSPGGAAVGSQAAPAPGFSVSRRTSPGRAKEIGRHHARNPVPSFALPGLGGSPYENPGAGAAWLPTIALTRAGNRHGLAGQSTKRCVRQFSVRFGPVGTAEFSPALPVLGR